MAKLKRETLVFDGAERREFSVTFDVYVNKDGSFTTTLPADTVKLFEDANINVQRNQLGNKGYYSATSYEGLLKDVKEVCMEFMSREMILEKIVVRYCIQTRCSYSFDKDGNIIPNPSPTYSGVPNKWNKEECHDESFAKWHGGNIDVNSVNPTPFGLLIYAKAFVKRDFKYKSGKTKTEYTQMCYGGEIAEQALENGYFLKWLTDVPCITIPEKAVIKEIDYTENICEFFVNMIKSICVMNEKIKDFLDPDAIQLLANQKTKLLG
jgi:hypothetical protein